MNLKKPPYSSRSAQSGISMIELMISATLGLLIMAGIFQIYINSKQSQRTNTAIFRLQENGRAAVNLMTSTTQMAGYLVEPDTSTSNLFAATGSFTLGAALSATNDDSASANGFKDNTDWFIVRYQGNSDDNLISDCVGNALPASDPAFPNDIFPITFGVSDNNELFCEPGSGGSASRINIADGVENMQLLYGVDSDDDQSADFYVDADSVSDFSTVVSIRVSLLIRSRDRVTSAPMAFTYGGITTTDPGDRRMRLVFNTTIALRNISG